MRQCSSTATVCRPASAPCEGRRAVHESPWMTIREAARYARCGPKTLYREVRQGRLRAARIGGRREIRLRAEWLDSWLEQAGTDSRAAMDWGIRSEAA